VPHVEGEKHQDRRDIADAIHEMHGIPLSFIAACTTDGADNCIPRSGVFPPPPIGGYLQQRT
jgi:hypothetical protein